MLYVPEPCRVPEDSEIGQGSGKKLDNDGVRQVLYQDKDQQNDIGQDPVRKLSRHSVYEQVGRRVRPEGHAD